MDDLISRKALLDEVSKMTIIPDDLYVMGIMAGVDAVKGKITEAPAIDRSRIVVLPCKVGEYWRDGDENRVRIETVSFSHSRSLSCRIDMVTYFYEDDEDECAANWIYFKGHFTREQAEAALKERENK